jgi:hypothetical protein
MSFHRIKRQEVLERQRAMTTPGVDDSRREKMCPCRLVIASACIVTRFKVGHPS